MRTILTCAVVAVPAFYLLHLAGLEDRTSHSIAFVVLLLTVLAAEQRLGWWEHDDGAGRRRSIDARADAVPLLIAGALCLVAVGIVAAGVQSSPLGGAIAAGSFALSAALILWRLYMT